MEWIQIIKDGLASGSTLAAIIGGLVGSLTLPLISYVKNKNEFTIQKRNQDKDNFQIILEERKEERDQNRKEIYRLREQLSILQAKVASLEGIIAQRPFPEWSLSFGKFTWCNQFMEHTFLLPMGKNSHWLIGKTPEEVWPPEIAPLLVNLDNKAKISENHLALAHNVMIYDTKYIIVKYGNTDIITGKIINYFGMAIPQIELES